jgi:hypothetical protein
MQSCLFAYLSGAALNFETDCEAEVDCEVLLETESAILETAGPAVSPEPAISPEAVLSVETMAVGGFAVALSLAVVGVVELGIDVPACPS